MGSKRGIPRPKKIEDQKQKKRKIIEYDYDEKTGKLEIITHNLTSEDMNGLINEMKKINLKITRIRKIK